MEASRHRASRTGRGLIAGVTVGVLALGGVTFVAAPAHAATFEVTTLTDVVDAGDGLLSLREAVDLANAADDPDVITFAAGLTGTIPLASGLSIVAETTIDGTGADVTISRDNAAGDFDLIRVLLPAYSPFTIVDVDIVADEEAPQQFGRGLVIEGAGGADIGRVQLTDVNVVGHRASPGFSGGGAYIAASTYVDVVRGSFSSNRVDDGSPGGGLHVDGGSFGSLHLTGTQVASNVAGTGGGVAVDQVNGVFVTDASFMLNTAASGSGGALDATEIAIDGVEIVGTTFTDNVAVTGGGAASVVDSGAPVIERSVFSGNRAEGGPGGAVYFDILYEPSVVTESTFRGNVAAGFGGALAYETLILDMEHSVTGSTFTANESGEFGASIGVFALGSAFLVQNSTLDELVAASAYALAVLGITSTGTLAVENSTITGPGAVGVATNSGALTVENSILDGRGSPVLESTGGAGSITYRHTLVTLAPPAGVTDGGGNIVSATTGLLDLADNGGPTHTRMLEPGSPALDAGDPAFAAPPVTDQRGAGYARVVNGRIDMGAVEILPTLPATGATVPWWLIAVAAGVLVLGVVALVLSRRRRTPDA